MKQEELGHELTELIRMTREKEKDLHWSLQAQTTDGKPEDEKPHEKEDGTTWTLDECYVSFYCRYKDKTFHDKEFCMITYELIKTAGEKTRSSNLVFVPPLAIRYFDLHTLSPYIVEASAVLLNQIHTLFVMLMEQHKEDASRVQLEVLEGTLTIED